MPYLSTTVKNNSKSLRYFLINRGLTINCWQSFSFSVLLVATNFSLWGLLLIWNDKLIPQGYYYVVFTNWINQFLLIYILQCCSWFCLFSSMFCSFYVWLKTPDFAIFPSSILSLAIPPNFIMSSYQAVCSLLSNEVIYIPSIYQRWHVPKHSYT